MQSTTTDELTLRLLRNREPKDGDEPPSYIMQHPGSGVLPREGVELPLPDDGRLPHPLDPANASTETSRNITASNMQILRIVRIAVHYLVMFLNPGAKHGKRSESCSYK